MSNQSTVPQIGPQLNPNLTNHPSNLDDSAMEETKQEYRPNSPGANYQKLFVTNIPGMITAVQFKSMVQPYAKRGIISDIKFKERVVTDTCYAFIEFTNSQDGKECMEAINRRIINGHTIRVGPAARRNPSLSDTNLYVEGLPIQWKDSDLRKCFERFGVIQVARVLTDKSTNLSKEVGFVHFTTHEEALLAMASLNGTKPFENAQREFQIKFANKAKKKDSNPKKLLNNKNNLNGSTNSNNNNNNSNLNNNLLGPNHMINNLLTNNNNQMNNNLNNMMSSNINSIDMLNTQLLNNNNSNINSSNSTGNNPSNRSRVDPNDSKFNEVCRYFQRGLCKRGNSCYYKHVINNNMYNSYLQPTNTSLTNSLIMNNNNNGNSNNINGTNTLNGMNGLQSSQNINLLNNMGMYNQYSNQAQQAYLNQYQQQLMYQQQLAANNPLMYQQQLMYQQYYQQQLMAQQLQLQQQLQINSKESTVEKNNNNNNNNSNNNELPPPPPQKK